jgi:DNA-3-methyladenine glycosylase
VTRSAPGEVLPREFYARDTELVARDLLGKLLRHRSRQGIASGRIVETEAYLGEHDAACHAAAGLTERTRFLYGRPGTAYVYFVYGMYWCVNAVTREEGLPGAVLIRAVEPVEGIPLMRRRRTAPRRQLRRPVEDLADGPGKLCIALGISGAQNGGSLLEGRLTILDGPQVPDARVSITPRIGITKAADWPLRFFETANPCVSGR